MHREAIVPGKGVGRDQKKGQGINKAEQGAEGGGGEEIAQGGEKGGCPYPETIKGMLETVEPWKMQFK